MYRIEKERNQRKIPEIPQVKLSYSYQTMSSLLQVQCKKPWQVQELNLIHCQIESLEGIEIFQDLRRLNIKFNNLKKPEEIYRIQGKGILEDLDISGNDIEHYSVCSFLNLRKNGFENLKYLNGRDYSRWQKKKGKKVPNTRNLYKQINKIEHSMAKTLKNSIKHKINEREQNESLISGQKNSQYTITKSQKYSDDTPLKQISLSNVNMVNSVKTQNIIKNRRSCVPLQINTSPNEDENHMPLTQPTATFASQREKQNAVFRGYNNPKSEINIILEDRDSNMNEYSYEEQLQESFQRPSVSKSTMTMKGTVYGEVEHEINWKQSEIVEAFYRQMLITKAFNSLKEFIVSSAENRPCLRSPFNF